MTPSRPLLLGHRGLPAATLEIAMEAFRAALAAGRDGFELAVQPTRDGVSMVLHDEDLPRTAEGGGVLRKMSASELPRLRNGEALPRLSEVLELPARLINVELKGEPGWQQALAAAEAEEALDKILFSSFEHSEVLQLWAACPQARCGFLWEGEEALDLSAGELEDLPEELFLHPPLQAVLARPETWAPYASRLVLWGMRTPKEASALPFQPYALISDGC